MADQSEYRYYIVPLGGHEFKAEYQLNKSFGHDGALRGGRIRYLAMYRDDNVVGVYDNGNWLRADFWNDIDDLALEYFIELFNKRRTKEEERRLFVNEYQSGSGA